MSQSISVVYQMISKHIFWKYVWQIKVELLKQLLNFQNFGIIIGSIAVTTQS